MTSEPAPAPIQHIIPRHYLKGFADSPARAHVWVYKKGQGYSTGNEINKRRNPFRQAIRSAGSARGVYRLVTLTGDLVDVDPTITKQEACGVQVLQQKLLARAPISAEDKVRFSLYIDLMMDRVPARASRALPFVRAAMKDFNWDLLARKAAEEGRFDLARKFDPRVPEYVAALEQELLLRRVPLRSEMIVKQIAVMRWLFFTVDGDHFFPTTDNPAFLPPGLGLAKDNGFILMPIDSQMVLLMSNQPWNDRQYVPATEDQYNRWRNVILAGATEKAYACRNDSAILDMLNSPRLPPPVPKQTGASE